MNQYGQLDQERQPLMKKFKRCTQQLEKVLKQYGSSVSKNVSILYGGSVKSINAKEIFDLEDVDGGLIGGASLDAREFIDIVNSIN